MGRCEVCDNEYDKTFEVAMPRGDTHTFDCFECAELALALVAQSAKSGS